MRKHTPGPWAVASESATFVYALGPNGTNRFWADVQAAGPERATESELKANARLIAAAPELLSSHGRLLANFRLLLERKLMRDVEETIAEAEAAIAKATGETA